MVNEKEILDILNNYQPTGPDDKLKTAVFADSKPEYKANDVPLRWLSVAAAIAILLSIAFYVHNSSQKEIKTPKTIAQNTSQETTVEINDTIPEMETFSLADIENRIQKAGIAARELAIADIFAKDPDNREYAIKQYQSIIKSYPDFEQAEIAKDKLTNLQKGI